MPRTTQIESIRSGATVTTLVSRVDPRTGERRDEAVITQRYEPLNLSLEDRGHEMVLA
jgi:hypothetical protein